MKIDLTFLKDSPPFELHNNIEDISLKDADASKGILRFTFNRLDYEEEAVLFSCVAKRDALLYQSFVDMINLNVKDLTLLLKGSYELDLFFFALDRNDSLNWDHFKTMVLKAAKKITPANSFSFRYSSFYCVLKMLGPSNYGKIKLNNYVKTNSQEPEKIDLLFKKLTRLMSGLDKKVSVIINDISVSPFFDLENQDQQERLKKFLFALRKDVDQANIILYLKDTDGVKNLSDLLVV